MYKIFNLLILAGGRGPIIVLMNFLGYGVHIGRLTFNQAGLEELWVVGRIGWLMIILMEH